MNESHNATPAIVILAAGRSSRMGAMKLLLPLGSRPVIAQVVATALSTELRPVIVVIGHLASQVSAALPHTGEIVIENAKYADGQSTSLHAGLAALPSHAPGVVVMLGDQPLVTPAQLTLLAAVASETGAPIIAASYGGRRGNPVFFKRTVFAELLRVTGDSGGREIFSRHRQDLTLVDMADASASLDIDDPDSYTQVQALWGQRHPPS